MARGSRLPERLLEALVFSIPLLLANVFFKYSYLRHVGLEVVQAGNPSSLSLVGYARIFARDVVESLFFFPLLLGGAGLLVGRRRRWLYFVCLELALLVGTIAWVLAYFTIGRIPTWELVREFVHAYRANPDAVAPSTVVAAGLLVKAALLLSLGVAPLFLLRSRWFQGARPPALAGLAVPVILVLGLSGGLLLREKTALPYEVGGFQRIVTEMLPWDTGDLPDASGLNVERLKALYDAVAFPGGRPSGPPGVAVVPSAARPSPNVIFVVLETASTRDYSLLQPDSGLPNVARLLPHALAAGRHHSTDPWSLRANFALYSSVYDLRGTRSFSEYVLDHPARPLDALPRLLYDRGYVTRYYFPHTLWPHREEAAMLRYLGFDEIDLYAYSTDDGRTPTERFVHAERSVYERVIEDLETLHARGRPFFFAIANSIGHAPFKDLRPAAVIASDPTPSREVRVRSIAAFMDGLIGEMVEKLRTLGLLDDTILVITGDHGPRNTVDDPGLDTRFSNQETFHVPLLIHYPRAFERPLAIEHLTSHVDIVPTVLQLMGAGAERYLHQGMSMFDPAIDERVTFFLGNHYTGCDGAHYEGRYWTVSGGTQATYVNNRFVFGPENLLLDSPGGAGHEDTAFFRAAPWRLGEVTRAWIAYVLAEGARQDRVGGPRGLVRSFLAKDDPGGLPRAAAPPDHGQAPL